MNRQQPLSRTANKGGGRRFFLVLMVAALAACTVPRPYKGTKGGDDIVCDIASSIMPDRCFSLTPEVSKDYRLHFVEFDDQGWLYPGSKDKGDARETDSANGQLDRAVEDVASRLKNGERVLLLVYVHGWKHGAAHDDRDVRRFREMLAEAAALDQESSQSEASRPIASTAQTRTVIGIYVGWRGAGGLSPSNPLINLTFWTRKNAALHVSEGAARELFARIRALRERWNAGDMDRPKLRTMVIGHSFGGWVVFSALSPSLLELFAQPVDDDPCSDPTKGRDAWRRARLKSAADMVILVNPAFEATRYKPIHDLAQRAGKKLAECKLGAYQPPALLIVTSSADAATGTAFKIGRFFNTLFQHPFVSKEEEFAAKRTPGFVEEYVTHTLHGPPINDLSGDSKNKDNACVGWETYTESASREDERTQHIKRMQKNAGLERTRHVEWKVYLNRNNQSLPPNWKWQYCGGTTIVKKVGASQSVNSPVWNVVTDRWVIRDHNDIMGERLHAFFRQLYRDLPR